MFLFAIALSAITVVYFVVGVSSQRLICDPLRYPNESQLINLADQLVNFKELLNVDVNISTALKSCHQNQSIYNVLNLERQFNLEDVDTYLDKFDINKTLSDLMSKINTDTTHIEIISDTAKAQLKSLVQSGISEIKYDKFIEEVSVTYFCCKLIIKCFCS